MASSPLVADRCAHSIVESKLGGFCVRTGCHDELVRSFVFSHQMLSNRPLDITSTDTLKPLIVFTTRPPTVACRALSAGSWQNE